MRTGTAIVGALVLLAAICRGGVARALTTDELLGLKESGVSEEIIVFMAENRYADVDKVLRLKKGGFRDETILAIIRSEAGGVAPSQTLSPGGAAPHAETVLLETAGRIRIFWYLVYRDGSVLQNHRAIDNVRIALLSDNVVSFEWKDKDELGLVELFRRKPFKSPFRWKLSPGDTLDAGSAGFTWRLTSNASRRELPPSDGTHFWVVEFAPEDPRVAERLRSVLPAK